MQFEIVYLQHIQMVKKTSSSKTKLISNNVEEARLTAIPFDV